MIQALIFFSWLLATMPEQQSIDVPDPNFESFLLNNYDTNGDGKISQVEAAAATGAMNCSSRNIADLTGIEYFVNINKLNCSNNRLVFLFFPKSISFALEEMNCSGNKLIFLAPPTNLVRLDCSRNRLVFWFPLPPNLKRLDCSRNGLKKLPRLPDGLKHLDCRRNNLRSLPRLPDSLKTLICRHNNLSALPTLDQTSLTELDFNSNKVQVLPTLPSSLEHLRCKKNELNAMPPALPDGLKEIDCSNNQLTDLPPLPINLKTLDCSLNQLTTLDLSNQPKLKEVDFSNNLLTVFPPFTDVAAQRDAARIKIVRGGGNRIALFNASPNIGSLEILDLSDNALERVSIQEPMSDLMTLDFSGNELRTLQNLSQHAAEHLDLSNNAFGSLQAVEEILDTLSPSLRHLGIAQLGLDTVPDLSRFTNLRHLNLAGNQLTAIPDLTPYTSLKTVDLSDNPLQDLDLGMLPVAGLTTLHLAGLALETAPDLSQLPDLTAINLSRNLLTVLDLDPGLNLTEINASDNRLMQITTELNRFPNLKVLRLSQNQLTALSDLAHFPNLRILEVAENELMSIMGLTGLEHVEHIDIRDNRLASLAPHVPSMILEPPNADNNPAMEAYHAEGNRFTYHDCPTALDLEAADIEMLTYDPQKNGETLVCTIEQALPLWNTGGDPRFCGALTPEIRDFIRFINNNRSCPEN